MSNFIDRRPNPRDKSLKNRQRFIARNKAQIKEAVREIIDKSSVGGVETAARRVRVKGTSEPTFRADHKSGNKKYILPGNKDNVVGDKHWKDEEGGGKGGKGGSPDGEGEDDFEFLLTQDEFLDFVFEDLELPDLVKKQLKDVTQLQYQRAGFKIAGTPSQLDIVRSLKNSLGRRIGLGRPTDEYIKQLEDQLAYDKERGASKESIAYLEEQLAALRTKQIAVPWLDPFDVRYRNFQPFPKPMTKAVMFCVMDISASMGEREKEIGKRFFMLLNLFLKRKYEKVEVVFISHHSQAEEVDEQIFFYSTKTGGTVVSTALELTNQIIKDRFPLSEWNIYVAQCSDGDNYSSDKEETKNWMEKLLGVVQYYAYMEVTSIHAIAAGVITDLWETYESLANQHPQLQNKKVTEPNQIWTIFRELFAKETKK